MATLFDILLNQQFNNNNKLYCNKLNSNSNSPKEQSKSIDFIPELDVIETQDSFIIEAELPGVNKQDIQIEIKDSKLIIQGEKKRQSASTVTSTTTATVAEDKPSIEDEFEDDVPLKSNKDQNKKDSPKETKQDIPKESIKKYVQERSFGNFKRYLDLTKILYTLDLSTIKTEFNNGLLTINISKKQDYSNTIKITL